MAAYYSTVWMDYIVFIHSSADGPLGCFQLWATVNGAVMNMVYVFLFEHRFQFFGVCYYFYYSDTI